MFEFKVSFTLMMGPKKTLVLSLCVILREPIGMYRVMLNLHMYVVLLIYIYIYIYHTHRVLWDQRSIVTAAQDCVGWMEI